MAHADYGGHINLSLLNKLARFHDHCSPRLQCLVYFVLISHCCVYVSIIVALVPGSSGHYIYITL